MPQAPEALMPNENLILTLGRPQGVETIVDLPGFKVAARTPYGGAGEEIVTARIDAQNGSIPGRWYGYDAARAIVLDTERPRSDVGARRSARPAAGRLGRARRAPGRRGRGQLAGRARQRAGADPAGAAQRAGAGRVARGARHASRARPSRSRRRARRR